MRRKNTAILVGASKLCTILSQDREFSTMLSTTRAKVGVKSIQSAKPSCLRYVRWEDTKAVVSSSCMLLAVTRRYGEPTAIQVPLSHLCVIPHLGTHRLSHKPFEPVRTYASFRTVDNARRTVQLIDMVETSCDLALHIVTS